MEGEVILTGLKDTKKALKQYAPEVLKEMNAEIKAVGKSVATLAKARIPEAPPMRGWRTVPAAAPRARGGAGWPAYSPSEMKKGIKFKTGGARRKKGSTTSDAYSLINQSAAGMIFELAGRTSNGAGSGVAFINDLNHIRKASRAIYSALDERGKREVAQAISDAVEKAEQALQAELNAANDREVGGI